MYVYNVYIFFIIYLISSKHDAFTNAASMLAYRLQRWPNIETAMDGCLVFAGYIQCMM